MDLQEVNALIISKGYEQRKYGFVKNGETISETITVFNDNVFQIFGWHTNDDYDNMPKLYDTGMIVIPELTHLELFIDTFNAQSVIYNMEGDED